MILLLKIYISDRGRGCTGSPWVEFCYNLVYQSSLWTSPFKVVYGCDPSSLRTYLLDDVRLPAVGNQLRDRDEFIMKVWEHHEQAQQHYKSFDDQHHRDLEFTPPQNRASHPVLRPKLNALHLCVPGSSFTHKVINSEINSKPVFNTTYLITKLITRPRGLNSGKGHHATGRGTSTSRRSLHQRTPHLLSSRAQQQKQGT
jgi:hypothetical protein